jgi:hypothetical protein
VTRAALDPWIAEGLDNDPAGELQRLEALSVFFDEVCREWPDLEVVPMLDYQSFWAPIFTAAEPRSRIWAMDQRVQTWLHKLTVTYDASPPAPNSLSFEPPPAGPLSARWLDAFETSFRPDEPTLWRDPILFIPPQRAAKWTTESEIAVTSARGTGHRVVAHIKSPEKNRRGCELFERDLDPWLYHCATPDALDIHLRRLPRPKCSSGVRRAELQDVLAGAREDGCHETDHVFFMPSRDWDPETVGKGDWRTRPFGAHRGKDTARGRKTGPADAVGRIWDWDDVHKSHWDVQDEDPDEMASYMNVLPDGFSKDPE